MKKNNLSVAIVGLVLMGGTLINHGFVYAGEQKITFASERPLAAGIITGGFCASGIYTARQFNALSRLPLNAYLPVIGVARRLWAGAALSFMASGSCAYLFTRPLRVTKTNFTAFDSIAPSAVTPRGSDRKDAFEQIGWYPA